MQQADFNGVSKPNQVFVGQFAFLANDPNPDQSIQNRMNSQSTPTFPQTPQEQAGLAVAQTMQKALIKDLTKEGIIALGTVDNIVPPVGTLVIEGELLTVKQGGSGLQPLSTGIGSGQANVVSYVSAYLVTPKGLVSFAKFYSNTQTSVDAKVDTTTAVGTGAGNVAGSVGSTVTTLPTQSQTAQSDARLIAKENRPEDGETLRRGVVELGEFAELIENGAKQCLSPISPPFSYRNVNHEFKRTSSRFVQGLFVFHPDEFPSNISYAIFRDSTHDRGCSRILKTLVPNSRFDGFIESLEELKDLEGYLVLSTRNWPKLASKILSHQFDPAKLIILLHLDVDPNGYWDMALGLGHTLSAVAESRRLTPASMEALGPHIDFWIMCRTVRGRMTTAPHMLMEY